MQDTERRRLDALKRCVQFYLDNIADLAIGVMKTKFQALIALVEVIDGHAAAAVANKSEGSGSTTQKGTVRENLREKCSAISQTAKGMEPDFTGISAIFRFTRNLNDADLLAKAQAFALSAIPYEANFIDYLLPATFLAELNAEIAAFETAIGAQTTNTDERVESNAALASGIGEAMQIKRSLRPLVRNFYNGNPGKIAAWESASHVEKAPVTPPAPPTP